MNTLHKSLASILPETKTIFPDLMLNGLCSDSRHIQEGELFFALSGADFNGVDFIDQAIDMGAAAIVLEVSEQWAESVTYRNTPVVVLENLDQRMSEIIALYYAYDHESFSIVGITGTNAKTSCSAYIQQLLNAMSYSCGVIGTLGWGAGEQLIPSGNTTPSNLLLHKILYQFSQQNVQYMAVEVSSHGLELGRIKGVPFKVAVMTNISRDHLDFHGDMQCYVDAKKKLFAIQEVEFAVINIDDEYAQEFIAAVKEDVSILTYGFSKKAMLRATNFKSDMQGMTADVFFNDESLTLKSTLIGDFNVYNLLASFGVLLSLGFKPKEIADKLPKVKAVKGRMQTIENELDLTVIVDFAHTPDGLENVLSTLKAHGKKSLWCVFGCGGDRDKGKRPLMGEIAGRYANNVVITSDNPRSELPDFIMNDIAQACSGEKVIKISDRKQAIAFALQHAEKGDCILIAGKGHEDYQETLGEKIYFSDEKVAAELLRAREFEVGRVS